MFSRSIFISFLIILIVIQDLLATPTDPKMIEHAAENWKKSNDTLFHYIDQYKSIPPIGYPLNAVAPANTLAQPLNCGWGRKRTSPFTGRVIDAILFNGEWDVLETRIYELQDLVDYFIVFEDEITFTVKPKTRTFGALVAERLSAFVHKIVYVDGSATREHCRQVHINAAGKGGDAVRDASFDCEISARNSLSQFIPGGVRSEDMILMTDTDEIVNRHWMRTMRECDFGGQCVGYLVRTYHYSLHWPAFQHIVRRTACPGELLLTKYSMQDVMTNKMNRKNINEDVHGWHISYFGSPRFIRSKLNAYAETQTNRAPYNELGYIRNHAYSGVELLERHVLRLTYQQQASLHGPWHSIDNMKHRPMFARYSKDDDRSRQLPACIHLKSVIGGLGNQLFAIAAVVARAHYLGMPYVMPVHEERSPGFRQSPTYWNSKLLERVMAESFSERDCQPVANNQVINLSQFQAIPTNVLPSHADDPNKGKDHNFGGSFAINGFLMSGSDVYPYSKLLRERFINYEAAEFKKKYPGRNLLIGFRSFNEEGRPDWKIPMEYYKLAIPKILRDDHTIHIFGDDGVEQFANEIKPLLKRPDQQVVVYPGKRANSDQTTEHIQYMMQCDDFVLCISTYHMWGAFLTGANDSTVVYPRWKDGGEWITKVAAPHWTVIDFK